MFLPALLLSDFGVWSFAAFAVPNVIGAALLGFVMRSPEASRVYIERYRAACVAFSIVTVAFQVFFAAWVARVMGAALGGKGGWLWQVGWVACVVAAAIGRFGGARWGRMVAGVAAGAWVVSLAVIVWVGFRQPGEGVGLEDVVAWPGERPAGELAPLAMVCVLGFMLCPYLDLTFHRARIESGAQSKRAFGVGFGVFFALMIVGTLVTAPTLLMLVGRGPFLDRGAATLLAALLGLHTLPQLVYTCWVHGCEVRGGERVWMVVAAFVAGLGIAVVDGGVLMSKLGPLHLSEVLYRVFMGFYGLVAPAYVAIVSWPVKLGGAEIRRGRVAVFTAVVVCAVWFYWLGFVERQTWWVACGVGMVVVGKLVGRFVEYQSSKLKAES
ncbi:MAG: hypothetical protein QM783_12465 [Phycisphaerales bacterium]